MRLSEPALFELLPLDPPDTNPVQGDEKTVKISSEVLLSHFNTFFSGVEN
jgi:hypothetical protein